MDKPENTRLQAAASERGRFAAARAKLQRKRVKAQDLLSRQSLQTAAALMRVARRALTWRGIKCRGCGKRLAEGASFCWACGAARGAVVPAKPLRSVGVKRPHLLRRVMAQLIDRLVTLPCLVLVYAGWPQWVWAAVAFQLLCDGLTGRSPGKWLCRLRVADAKSLARCKGPRAVLRRVGTALGQAAYCQWEWLPFALGYDFLSFLFVWRDRAGQRMEDKLLGTRVLSEGAFRQRKQECSACGIQLTAHARFCSRCGSKPKQSL